MTAPPTMHPVQCIAVFTTVATRPEAEAMAAAMVERNLAACAQISEIRSVYAWDGAVRNEAEFRIVFKTTAALYPAIETAIRGMHAYELPAIHALAFAHVFDPYARWIADNTQADS